MIPGCAAAIEHRWMMRLQALMDVREPNAHALDRKRIYEMRGPADGTSAAMWEDGRFRYIAGLLQLSD